MVCYYFNISVTAVFYFIVLVCLSHWSKDRNVYETSKTFIYRIQWNANKSYMHLSEIRMSAREVRKTVVTIYEIRHL